MAVETVVTMASVATTAPAPMTPGVDWRCRNEKKRNCQEGDRNYLSHTPATSLHYKRSSQAMRRQRFDLTASVCVDDNQFRPRNNGCRGPVPQRHHDEVMFRIVWRCPPFKHSPARTGDGLAEAIRSGSRRPEEDRAYAQGNSSEHA